MANPGYFLFVVLCVLSSVESKSLRLPKRSTAGESSQTEECPQSSISEGIDKGRLAGNWIIVNTSEPLFSCYQINIQQINSTTAVLTAFSSHFLEANDTSVCNIDPFECYDADNGTEVVFQVIAADPDRYVIVEVCAIFGPGQKFQNIEVDVRPDIILTKEELDVIQDKLKERGYKPSLMDQNQHEGCNYNF